jgi:hypothetical protein
MWKTGVLSTGWTEATVIPILKPGKDPNEPKSYRSILLTSCMWWKRSSTEDFNTLLNPEGSWKAIWLTEGTQRDNVIITYQREQSHQKSENDKTKGDDGQT